MSVFSFWFARFMRWLGLRRRESFELLLEQGYGALQKHSVRGELLNDGEEIELLTRSFSIGEIELAGLCQAYPFAAPLPFGQDFHVLGYRVARVNRHVDATASRRRCNS